MARAGRWAASGCTWRPLEEHSPAVVELGYRLNQAAWGRGYATEGSRALIHKGFTDLEVGRVTANTMAVNTRSRRVMEKSACPSSGTSPGTGRSRSRAPSTVKSSTNLTGSSGNSFGRPQRPRPQPLTRLCSWRASCPDERQIGQPRRSMANHRAQSPQHVGPRPARMLPKSAPGISPGAGRIRTACPSPRPRWRTQPETCLERGGRLTCVSGIAYIGGRSLAVLRLLRPFSHHSRQYFQP